MKTITPRNSKHGKKPSRWAKVAPSMEEMELWPDLSWRLSALIRAGLTPARAFHLLELEATNEIQPVLSRTERLAQIFRPSTEYKALALGKEDIKLLLHVCAESAQRGLPLAVSLEELSLEREYSSLKVAELSACWRIGEQTGAPLAKVLERLARYYEQEIDLSQARESAMSGPKSTGTILSWLPILGLGLGMLMGTNPLGILLGSIPGAVAAFVGVFLALVGRSWTARLVQRAEKGLDSS